MGTDASAEAQASTTRTPSAAGPLAERPGKIVAVHLAYLSRAEQRGRRPAAPSYFLKPTQLARRHRRRGRAAGGYGAARVRGGDRAGHRHGPPGTCSVEQAWDHVAAVTAANDLGVYDLRWADKGSNVRSKGRDGYTPSGRCSSTPARSIPPGCACAPGSTASWSRTTPRARRAAVPVRADRGRPVPAPHARDRRRHPHGNPGRLERGGAGRRRRSRGGRPDGAGRSVLGSPGHHGGARRAAVRRRRRRVRRSTTCSGRRRGEPRGGGPGAGSQAETSFELTDDLAAKLRRRPSPDSPPSCASAAWTT